MSNALPGLICFGMPTLLMVLLGWVGFTWPLVTTLHTRIVMLRRSLGVLAVSWVWLLSLVVLRVQKTGNDWASPPGIVALVILVMLTIWLARELALNTRDAMNEIADA